MLWSRLVVAAGVLGLFVWFFAAVMFHGELLAHRDAAHFYYPLLKFVHAEWSAGRVPLWNPHENLGLPLAAVGMTSVFYPGQLLFRLPLPYATLFAAYTVAHLLLAAGTTFRTARSLGSSIEGSGIAALSYAFGSVVLFQTTNVVYLVGAAWLPLALLCAVRLATTRRPPWALGLGGVLALMFLGGDPQTAYHAGLLAVLFSLIVWRAERRLQHVAKASPEDASDSTLWSRVALLAQAALVAGGLAAVQMVPSLELTRLSDRYAFDRPRSLYEVPAYLLREKREPANGHGDEARDLARPWYAGLLAVPAREPYSHDAQIEQFSVGPWRLAELLWPNVAGRQFPIYRRWLDSLPAEGRTWVPSLYIGVIPLVLALTAFRLRNATPEVQWLSGSLLLATVASFGGYGPGWLAGEILHATGRGSPGELPLGGGCGGLYWLGNLLLPGYVQFRYPAKWLVVAALALSLLSARGFDAAVGGQTRVLRRMLLAIAGLSLLGVVAALAISPWWNGWFATMRASSLLGPFDADGARRDVLFAFAQSALVALAAWWMLMRRHGSAAALFVLLVVVDLGLANRWLVPTAPRALWQTDSPLAEKLIDQGGPPAERVYRSRRWYPAAWLTTSSPDRLAEAIAWERATLAPRYHLAERLTLLGPPFPLMTSDMLMVVAELRAREASGDERTLNEAIALLGASDRIGPLEERPGEHGSEVVAGTLPDVRASKIPAPLPRAWIASQVAVVEPIDERDLRAVRERTEEVLFPPGGRSDPRAAVVETDSPIAPKRTAAAQVGDRNDATDRCAIVVDEPQRVEIEAVLSRPGLVVLGDQYFPGWRLNVVTDGESGSRRVPILRTNRVQRGAWLPAGRHRLIYRYQPASYSFGLAISLTSLLLVSGGLVVPRLRSQRRSGA